MELAPSKRGPYYARERTPDLLTSITFFPGRSAYYRSNSPFEFKFYLPGMTKYMYFEFTDREQAFPGDEVSAWFWLMRPEMQFARLASGLQFEIELYQNGVVGKGVVTDVLDFRLRKEASSG